MDKSQARRLRMAILSEAGYQLLPSEQEAFLNGWYQCMQRLETLHQVIALQVLSQYLDRQVCTEYD